MGCAGLVVRQIARTSYPTRHRQTRSAGLSSCGAAELTTPRVCPETSTSESVDLDAVEDLNDQIATLSAHIHAATHRLLVLIAELDRLRGWELAGYRNCARWLAARTGIDLGAAREKVRAARALEVLPLTGEAMARGELSFSQVRALTRVADAESEPQLLELARGATTAQLERVVRAWKKGSRTDEAAWERERRGARTLSVFPDDDGMYVVTGRLTPDLGALLIRAIEAASDALYRDRRVSGAVSDAVGAQPRKANDPEPTQPREVSNAERAQRPKANDPGQDAVSWHGTKDSDREAARRCADALALLAERALAAGFGGAGGEGPATEVPISGTRAERYQVLLHVDAETLSRDEQPGRSELEDGTRVSSETSRRISCDASVVRVAHEKGGSVLDVGRKTRTISPALRRALEVRDRGCRFPGCHLRFCDAHHVTHWASGGETSMSNCLLLCKFHHTLVHEGGWRVQWWGKGRPVFHDPRGNAHVDGRWNSLALPEEPVAALIRQNERRGIKPDAWTAGARWEREADIPDRVYFAATEAR